MPADLTSWSSQVLDRLKVLLNVKEISGETGEEDTEGDGDEAKRKRAAVARNRNSQDVQAAHQALTVLAFSGYQDWCEYDDDAWLRNCLGQVLDEDQAGFLASALYEAGLIDLTTAVQLMAGPYQEAWRLAADSDAAPPGALELSPAENLESWKYSRTPGTRYYIFHDGQYLYADSKDAPLAEWATAEDRDDEAAARATEWESGSGVFYTSYAEPAYVDGAAYVFGEGKDGPWILDRAQAEQLLAAAGQSPAGAGVAAAGSPIEPYFDTGHFTRYEDGAYLFGETAAPDRWYGTYEELLDALSARDAVSRRRDSADDADRVLQALFDQVPAAAAMSLDDLFEAIHDGLSGAEQR